MANPKHIGIVKRGPAAVRRWKEKERLKRRAELAESYRALGGRKPAAAYAQFYPVELDLSGADVSGLDLSKMDLIRADLRGAKLNEARLDRAKLEAADLSGADLQEAKLVLAEARWASLVDANLEGGELMGADFREADLTRANLAWTNLADANLSQARMWETGMMFASCQNTTFGDIDLSTAVGLDRIIHRGPSILAVGTLFKKDKSAMLPLEFLRGVGLPESLITYLPSLTWQGLEFYAAFIS
jgi:uncharacterized protein YjbI with pentapeptide repeats